MKTIVIDEDGNRLELDLSKYNFLPNKNIFAVYSLIAKEKESKIKIIYDYFAYDYRQPHVSVTRNEEFKYPLLHSTRTNGNSFFYSSRNNLGHFGITKVLIGESGINDVIIDMEGKYGLTPQAIGIQVSSLKEAINIKTALLSKEFKKIIKSTIWSNFRIDFRFLEKLKKDFWRYFI